VLALHILAGSLLGLWLVKRDNFHIVLALHILAGSLLGLWLAPLDPSSLDTCESAAGVCGHQQRVVGFPLYSTCQPKAKWCRFFLWGGGDKGVSGCWLQQYPSKQ
jgi:hypothetical protein